jgi:N-methylhydantoinase A
MHYHGQTFELGIPVPDGTIDHLRVADLEEAFGREHERTYGHRAGLEEPVEIVSLQVISDLATARAPALPDAAGVMRRETDTQLQPRFAYFGPEAGWLKTPVLRRRELASPREGPCIVEEYDATSLVPPAAHASLDRYGNILIDL